MSVERLEKALDRAEKLQSEMKTAIERLNAVRDAMAQAQQVVVAEYDLLRRAIETRGGVK
jgi:hypothetical protein